MKKKKMLPGGLIAAIGAMTPMERAKGRYMRAPDHFDFTGKSPAEIGQMIKRKLDAVQDGTDEVKSRLDHFEQEGTRPGYFGFGGEVKSYGQQVAESDGFKALQASGYQGRVRIEMKAITSGSSSAGGLIVPDRDGEIVRLAKRETLVRDLLTVVPTTSGSVDYPKQTLRDNKAAPVAEGQQKPYSAYGWTKQNVPVRTIAHLAKLTRQAMDDAEQLQAEVDQEMRYGLSLAEDAQILFGDNTGENLFGLTPQATAFVLPAGFVMPSNPTYVDKLGAAILQQALTEYAPDGIVMHPTDWFTMRMLKSADGKYLFGDPGADIPKRLFGLPIAVTQGQMQGRFLLGAFKPQKFYVRLAPEVLLSSENADDFEKNLLTMRCEERAALAARQPQALIKGSFAD